MIKMAGGCQERLKEDCRGFYLTASNIWVAQPSLPTPPKQIGQPEVDVQNLSGWCKDALKELDAAKTTNALKMAKAVTLPGALRIKERLESLKEKILSSRATLLDIVERNRKVQDQPRMKTFSEDEIAQCLTPLLDEARAIAAAFPDLHAVPALVGHVSERIEVLRAWVDGSLAVIEGKPQTTPATAPKSAKRWSKPHGLKEWSNVFGQSETTMRKWLREGNVKNEQVSPRRWKVVVEELPDGYENDPKFVQPSPGSIS
jgi:hypothetical protein